jgi:hypothetical protein
MIDENLPPVLPPDLLKRYANEVFVESGTFHGEAVQTALDVGFHLVFSVEISYDLFVENKKKFAGQEKVQLYWGDSVNWLPTMINVIRRPITFWLNARGMERDNLHGWEHGEHTLPLMVELDIIKKHPIKNHIIMINRAHLIKDDPEWKGVKMDLVRYALSQINPGYRIEFEDSNYISQDILVAHL